MAVDIIDKYIIRPWESGLLMKIIFINIAIYILITLCGTIWNGATAEIVSVLCFPSSWQQFLLLPWTLFTYMWIHTNLWHLLFNMAWLYWLGGMFLQAYTARQMLLLYISGGAAGAFFYMGYTSAAFPEQQSMLMGASAAVMAIITATALKRPDFRCYIPLLGSVALKWIALVALILLCADFISETGGGRFSHIGGVIAGVIFFIVTMPRKVKRRVPKEPQAVRYKNIDDIIDKVKRSGYSALTDEEKRRLFDVEK